MPLSSDYLRSLLEKDPERGVYRCKREMLISSRLFKLKTEHTFEGNWVHLVHESQVVGVSGYLITQISRQSIAIVRNYDGQLSALINACSHRGAMFYRYRSGNRNSYTCPFHGWTFNSPGRLLKVGNPTEASYPQGFNYEGPHDLTRVTHFGSYCGFLFGNLNPDVRLLAEHLDESTKIINMIADQPPEGLEVLRGSPSYIYKGNWELTAGNGANGYRVSLVHWNYAVTQSQRQQRDATDQLRTMSATDRARQDDGFYSFGHGHILLWGHQANPEDRPAFEHRTELAHDFGEARVSWAIENSRNSYLYPNIYLMNRFSSQIRIARPLSVDRAEITVHYIAPKGGGAEARARHIRQYEGFFNVNGVVTPDDLEEPRSCQQSYQSSVVGWNDLSRSAGHWVGSADVAVMAIDLRPRLNGVRTEDEGLFVLQHRYWQEALFAALERKRTQRVALREVVS